MAELNAGRVAVVTGAGSGIGRSHALALAASGAAVVVNDVASARDKDGCTPAEAVVAEIVGGGGRALVNADDISTDAGALSLVEAALSTYGDLHVLVNSAGILSDRMPAGMGEEEWDAAIAVHLRGTVGPSRHAARYWRDRSKAGTDIDARIIITTSALGAFTNVGQASHGAAKIDIAALTLITSMHPGRHGITVNVVVPRSPAAPDDLARYQQAPGDLNEAGEITPDDISPIVVWLASSDSRSISGRVFSVAGATLSVLEGWHNGPAITRDEGRWNAVDIGGFLPDLVKQTHPIADMYGETFAP